MLAACERSVKAGETDLSFFRLGGEAFAVAPSLSVDRAVMEHSKRVAVVPTAMAWSDVGSWHALRDIGKSDETGNVFHVASRRRGKADTQLYAREPRGGKTQERKSVS
jgi:mannose-1-phosphate guanylyltransferase